MLAYAAQQIPRQSIIRVSQLTCTELHVRNERLCARGGAGGENLLLSIDLNCGDRVENSFALVCVNDEFYMHVYIY